MTFLPNLLCLVPLLCVTKSQNGATDDSVQLLQQYVRINTTTDSDLAPAVAFWTQLATEAGLYLQKHEIIPGYPVLVIRWPGSNSSLGSIMLNSHMDVVPAVQEEGWIHAPFSGDLDSDGFVWGRGTQDMKSVSLQYFQALRRLKSKDVQLLRDVYMTLVPDEEVGSINGMIPFLRSDAFKAMNVGVELDEGSSFNITAIPVFYQDKVPWHIQVDCYGQGGHSSTFLPTNAPATGKCYNVMKKMFEFRDAEYAKYLAAGLTGSGAYSSISLNKINGGTANNVIPSVVTLVFDIRLGTSVNEEIFDAQLKQWVAEAGPNVTLTYILKEPQSPATVISDQNPYWTTFSRVAQQLNLTIVPIVPPGSTDARHVREAGCPAFGFSPMPSTELLLHSVNERLSTATFLRGIDIYEAIIQGLANIPANQTTSAPNFYVVKTAN